MELRFAAGTRDYLRTLAPSARKAVRDALRLLQADPRHPKLDVKQLRKDGSVRFYRVRVRDYRIVYSPSAKATYVWRIMHRSEGYEWMERLES